MGGRVGAGVEQTYLWGVFKAKACHIFAVPNKSLHVKGPPIPPAHENPWNPLCSFLLYNFLSSSLCKGILSCYSPKLPTAASTTG